MRTTRVATGWPNSQGLHLAAGLGYQVLEVGGGLLSYGYSSRLPDRTVPQPGHDLAWG
jgi:hypothetical protein